MNDNDNESQRLAAQISKLKKSYAAGKRNFSEINLVQANLVAITLDKAELTRANLEGVNLRLASLQGVYLTRVNLSYSNLAKANLSGANLIGANLSNADLSDANCAGAFLNEANLYGANLSRVNLTGASLYKVNLTQTNLRGAYYDEKTCFDQGFDPIAAQMVKSQAIDLEPFLEEMLEEGLTKLEELEVSGTQPLVGGTSLARPVAVESSPIQSVKTNSFVSQSESLNQSDLEIIKCQL